MAESELGARPRKDETKVHGVSAVRALAESRIDDVIRVYLEEDRIRDFADLLRWCAANRKAYHLVNADELARVAETVHHEGICVLARGRMVRGIEEFLAAQTGHTGPDPLLLLENVENPHNLGAILRTAAHFGVRAVAISEPRAALTGAAHRTAAGGAEAVELLRATVPARAIELLRAAGYTMLATTSQNGRSIYEQPLPARAVFVIGSEGEGLSEETVRAADRVVTIPGTGNVESLNVAAACAVVLAEHYRTHRAIDRKKGRSAAPTVPRRRVRPRRR